MHSYHLKLLTNYINCLLDNDIIKSVEEFFQYYKFKFDIDDTLINMGINKKLYESNYKITILDIREKAIMQLTPSFWGDEIFRNIFKLNNFQKYIDNFEEEEHTDLIKSCLEHRMKERFFTILPKNPITPFPIPTI